MALYGAAAFEESARDGATQQSGYIVVAPSKQSRFGHHHKLSAVGVDRQLELGACLCSGSVHSSLEH
jgi:hypothetical protein